MRGLAVVQAVADGARDLSCAPASAWRAAPRTGWRAAWWERYLRVLPGVGYALGPADRTGLPGARGLSAGHAGAPYLDGLADLTGDTIHLAVRDNDEVLYLEKIPGKKGLEMRSRVGHRMPLAARAWARRC